MAKPNALPRWAELEDGTPSAEIIEPNAARKDVGFNNAGGDVPTAGEFNWLFATILGWAKWLLAGTSAKTASTLMERDAAGRTKVVDPAAADDVDTKGARDAAVAAAVLVETNARVAADAALLAQIADMLVPLGGAIPYGGAADPAGGRWLIANGRALPRNGGDYDALFAAIGIGFGAGDGITTFNIPDLRGEFVRGLDGGRGVDAGRVLGSAQADAIKTHTHPYGDGSGDIAASGNSAPIPGGQGVYQTGAHAGAATETRPRNVAMNYIVRVK